MSAYVQLSLALIADRNFGDASETRRGSIAPVMIIVPVFVGAGEFSLAFSDGIVNIPFRRTANAVIAVLGNWYRLDGRCRGRGLFEMDSLYEVCLGYATR